MSKKVKVIAFVTIPFRWALPAGCEDEAAVIKDNQMGVSDLAKRIEEGFKVKHMSMAPLTTPKGQILYSHYYLERD